jgi:hypothetical protein
LTGGEAHVLILFSRSQAHIWERTPPNGPSADTHTAHGGRQFSYWVALLDEKCTGANHEKIGEFCRVNGLSLSRFGHAVVWEKEWYQVFRFGRLEDADHFMREFGGERMHPSERGKGKRWAQWRKGSYRP